MKIVVYTAITNGFDELKEQQNTQGADFVAFLDFAPEQTIWQARKAHVGFSDPVRDAKIHKILPQRYLPEYDYWLWMDGTLTLRVPAKELVEKYLGGADIALFAHSCRRSVGEELACIGYRKDDPQIMTRQVEGYQKEGFPDNLGLWECTMILRRNTKAVREFNKLWWEEIKKGSRRDQLSFPYVCWKTGIKINTIPGNVYNGGNDYFYYQGHN